MTKTPEELWKEQLNELEALIFEAAERHASRWQGCQFALGARIGIEAVTSAFLEGVDYTLNLKNEPKLLLSDAIARAIEEGSGRKRWQKENDNENT